MKKSHYFLLFIIGVFLFLPKEAFALESYNLIPNSMQLYRNDELQYETLNVTTKNYSNIDFYGYTILSQTEKMGVGYIFKSNDIVNKKVNLQFVIRHSIKSSYLNPINVFLHQNKNNVSVCKVSTPQQLDFYKLYGVTGGNSLDTISQTSDYLGLYSTVSCENVYLDNPNFALNIFDHFSNTNTNNPDANTGQSTFGHDSFLGISSVHATYSPDDLTSAVVDNTEEIKKQTEATKEQTDVIKDKDTSEAQTESSDFFKNFNSDAHGLSGIVTAPISFLQSLTAASCTPLKFELPIVHNQVTLPCMKSIYQAHFGVFFSLWQLLTTGLISYNVCLNFYKKVRDLQNPNNDRIEVLNL